MTEMVFWLGFVLVLVGPVVGLVVAQRRYQIDSLWYGLAFLGAVASVVSLLVRDLVFRVYAALAAIPEGISSNTIENAPAF